MKKILLTSFLLLICVFLFAQSKLSPQTNYFVQNRKQNLTNESQKLARTFSTKEIGTQEYISAYIYLNTDTDLKILEDMGVKPGVRLTKLITAQVPVNKIEEIARLEEVKYVQIGTPVRLLMDKARVTSFVDEVQAGTDLSGPFLGKDVVVGIIDNGFEYGHINFYNQDQTELRVKRVWDQNGTRGGTAPEEFGYGKEYKTQEEILKAKYDMKETHATHVTGIAAGADRSNDNNYYGVAGEADLVLVSMRNTDSADNVEISDGIKYIYDYAESVNKPCVINMSLGVHVGPHDGTSAFDQITDALQGKGKLLVGAAGNEGADKFHISKNFESTSSLPLKSFVKFVNTVYPLGEIDIWGDENMQYSIQLCIYDKKNDEFIKEFDVFDASLKKGNQKNYSVSTSSEGMSGNLFISTEINPVNNKPHAYIQVYLNTISKTNHVVGFIITPLSKGTVHAWADDYYSTLSNYGLKDWTNGNNEYSVGEIGGTGKRIISVGAYVSKNSYKDINERSKTTGQKLNGIASFSSKGPTVDGRIKPDIVAPGTMIASSISSYTSLASEEIIKKTTWNNKIYYYGMMQGTSMASPYVTGVLATWLQAKTDLTPEEVREILKETAIQDTYTTETGEENNTWGYGKIDAWNGIKKVIKMSGISSSSSLPKIAILPPTNGNRTFRVLFTREDPDVRIHVYNTNGQTVYTQNVGYTETAQEISVTLTTPGIYIIQVAGNDYAETHKMVIK